MQSAGAPAPAELLCSRFCTHPHPALPPPSVGQGISLGKEILRKFRVALVLPMVEVEEFRMWSHWPFLLILPVARKSPPPLKQNPEPTALPFQQQEDHLPSSTYSSSCERTGEKGKRKKTWVIAVTPSFLSISLRVAVDALCPLTFLLPAKYNTKKPSGSDLLQVGLKGSSHFPRAGDPFSWRSQ